jgi:hypothetical protein
MGIGDRKAVVVVVVVVVVVAVAVAVQTQGNVRVFLQPNHLQGSEKVMNIYTAPLSVTG